MNIQTVKIQIIDAIQQPLWFSILALFFSFITAAAIILYIIQYTTQKRRNCTEKAIEYAKIYADNILIKGSYINLIFRLADLNIDNKIKSNQMIRFTKEEFKNIGLSESDFTQLIPIIFKKRKKNILLKSRAMILGPNYFDTIIDKCNNESELIEVLSIEFDSLITDTLNTLEYMSMSLNTEMGDSKVIYQSLHQTYIRIIKYLYYYISKLNLSGCDKYYTNIIDLYKTWIKIYNDKYEEEFNSKDEITVKPKKIYKNKFKK